MGSEGCRNPELQRRLLEGTNRLEDEEGCYMAGSGPTREDIRRLEGAFSKVVAEETGLPVKVRIETVLSSHQELLAFLDNSHELTEEQRDRLFSIYSLEEGMYDNNGRQACRILLEKAISRDLLTLDFVRDDSPD